MTVAELALALAGIPDKLESRGAGLSVGWLALCGICVTDELAWGSPCRYG